jgi:hypothetical protein
MEEPTLIYCENDWSATLVKTGQTTKFDEEPVCTGKTGSVGLDYTRDACFNPMIVSKRESKVEALRKSSYHSMPKG